MNNIILYTLSIIISCNFISCKKNKSIVGSNDGVLEPGRRDYTWTVDTLKANPGDLFYMFSLWGNSPMDVWATGSGDASDLTMWHYDGQSWTRDLSRLSSNMMCVFGFAQNNVYMCDAPGRGVYHYNGLQWSNVYTYSDVGTYLYSTNIWGDAPNNIYVAGAIYTISAGDYKGAILHFDGNTWRFLSISNYRIGFTWIRRGIYESTKYYLSAVRYESTGDTNKIFELDGINLKEIYSGQEITSVNEMSGCIYHCIGKKIYKYQNDKLIVWKDFSGTTHGGRLWGRSEADFFTIKSDGLAHYNGTDLSTIFPTNMFINDTFVFEKDIFILCNNRIIIHGKLQ